MPITKVQRHLGSDLRERPDDPDALERAINAVRADLTFARQKLERQPEDTTTLGILARELNKFGDLLGLRGDLKEAEQHLREAIVLWQQLSRAKALLMSRLKLAAVLRYQRREGETLALLDDLLTASEEPGMAVYKPFILMEMGFNSARSKEARERSIREALVFFTERRSKRHIAYIEVALKQLAAPGSVSNDV